MINDHERNTLKMQDQIEKLSRLLLDDWQELEIHTVEYKIFRALLRIGNKALATYVEKKIATLTAVFGIEIEIFGM